MSYVIKDDKSALFEVRTTFEITPEFIRDIFTTALEGGIGYWSVCSTYKWDVEPVTAFRAVICQTEEDDNVHIVIDYEVILRGLDKLATEYPERFIRSVRDEDYDAEDADMVVQLGLFGEVVYG